MNIPYHHPAFIEVDLAQFKRNVAIIRKNLNAPLFCLPVKANAYGHGLVPMAKAAASAHIDYLAVSCLKEGAELREAGIGLPILVMGAIHEEQIPDLMAQDLDITISSPYKAALVAKACSKHNMRCRVHIELDTGMQRTGMRVDTALELLKELNNYKGVDLVGAYSHLATSDHKDDPFAHKQIQMFHEFKQQASSIVSKNVIYHLANSGGVCHYPQAHFDMVRPGILTFGYFSGDSHREFSAIKPFFSLKAKIAYFKVVEKDEGISYGHKYRTKEKTRIVTIPVGYGDGFRRSLSHQASVLIRGKRYPVVGTICMDQLMVDIGEDEAYVGEEAVLIGHQQGNAILLLDIARLCDTIPYEILCGFNQRLPRFYIDDLVI